ncbi:Cell division protein FtsL [bacterium HR25]|jgi:cell division protein FtsL|nr:Cell division protein FtsL [bacterium HR25]
MAAVRPRVSLRPSTWPLPWLGLPLVIVLSSLAVGLAALLPLTQYGNAATTSASLDQLERDRSAWQARVDELEAEVARLSSLDRIEREARERLGMVPPEEVVYIEVPVARPEGTKVPDRYLERPARAEGEVGADSAWWEKLLGWLPLP